MASPMALYPGSLGWRWSPWSKAGRNMAGLAGSWVALSKSMKPSIWLVVRIHWLRAWRDLLAGGRGVACADVGRQRGDVDLDAVGVGALGHLNVAGDEVVGGDDVVDAVGVVGVADVVDGLEDDDVLDAGLRDDVAVEAGERAGAGVVVQDAVAADALVEDAEVGGALVGQQAAGEFVGPAGVGVERGEGAVGDAVAEGDDGGAVRGDLDVDALDEGPGADLGGAIEGLGADDVAGRGVAGLVGGAVLREMGDGLRGKEEADGEIGGGGQVHRGGIADHQRAGRNDDGGASAEGEAGGGDEIDGAAALADGDVRRADGERLGAELVGEDDADLRAADGDVHDLAQGGVGRAVDDGGRTGGRACGSWRGAGSELKWRAR